MGLITGGLLVVVVLIAALAALNWGLLVAPTLMSLGFMQTSAPFGLIMLGLTVLLGVLLVSYVVYLQSSVLLETRRHNREMQTQRDLADKAEASRFTELRNFLEAQATARSAQTENSLAAHIGQLEDRLERRPMTSHTDVVPAGVPSRF
jgi:uncharacterized integral membrane protein